MAKRQPAAVVKERICIEITPKLKKSVSDLPLVENGSVDDTIIINPSQPAASEV